MSYEKTRDPQDATSAEQRAAEIQAWAKQHNAILYCSMCQIVWLDGAPQCECGYENMSGNWQPALAVEMPAEQMGSGNAD